MENIIKKWIMARVFGGNRWAKGNTAWTPLPRPVSELRLALISSGGVYREDQPPFDAANLMGDWSFRVIPNDTLTSALRVSHNHYNHKDGADKDINVVFPLDRLRELEAQSAIGELSTVHIGFMGYILKPDKLIKETAPLIIQALKDASVEAVLLVPS